MCKLVSIIIPTYGRPLLLARAIESVINQTYDAIEIFVVDDNDPDTEARKETESLMKKYIYDCRVHYIKHQFNQNGAAARNTGLKEAKGEYITFLDDDDEMLPDRISYCVSNLENHDNSWGACYTNFTKYKTGGKIDTCGESKSGNLYKFALSRSLYIGSGSNLFLRTNSVREIGGYDQDFYRNQDLEFMARFLEHNKILYLPKKTFIIHYEDSRRSENEKTKLQRYKKLVEIDEFYIRKFDGRISKLSKEDQKKIFKVIALERLRYSIRYNMICDGIRNCAKNHVDIFTLIRYLFYVIHRGITGKVYGFKL